MHACHRINIVHTLCSIDGSAEPQSDRRPPQGRPSLKGRFGPVSSRPKEVLVVKARSRGAQLRERSGDATAARLAAPCSDLVLDRELQFLEPRDQDLVGYALPRFPIDFGFEAGMLAPEIMDMFGHLLLHAKLRMLQPGRLRLRYRNAGILISMG